MAIINKIYYNMYIMRTNMAIIKGFFGFGIIIFIWSWNQDEIRLSHLDLEVGE